MVNEISIQIAGILGPVLMMVTSSEFLNFKIWEKIDPTVVSLNGLVLVTGGLIIIRLHPFWHLDWTLLVTLFGWLLFLAGAFRLFFPRAKQAQENVFTRIFIITLFLIGGFLTYKGYFR